MECNSSMFYRYCAYEFIVVKLGLLKFPNQSVSFTQVTLQPHPLAVREVMWLAESAVDAAILRPWCPPCLSTRNSAPPTSRIPSQEGKHLVKPQPTSQITVWVSDNHKHTGLKGAGPAWRSKRVFVNGCGGRTFREAVCHEAKAVSDGWVVFLFHSFAPVFLQLFM